MPTRALILSCMQSQNRFCSLSNVIFDLDGTLIDSAPSILECFRATLKKKGCLTVVNLDNSLVGPPLRDTIKLLANERDPIKIDALVEEFKFQYDQGICNLALPYFGISELLSELKIANKNIYIVTNKRHYPTKKIIASMGWEKLVDGIYTIDYPSVHLEKKSSVLNQLLADFSLSKEAACYVGDRFDDWEAAKENGLQFVHALWGYGALDKVISNSCSVDNPNQLRNLLIK